MAKKNGRPTIYTDDLGTKICTRIANGESIRTMVKGKDMPSSSTIFRWLLDEEYKSFWEQYEKARNIQAELMFEELIEIADAKEADVMRDRLRVDTRKWYLSKIVPKKYGDKVDVTSGGKPMPLLNLNVLRDDSNKEDSKTEEED
jgi:hypothetical protein